VLQYIQYLINITEVLKTLFDIFHRVISLVIHEYKRRFPWNSHLLVACRDTVRQNEWNWERKGTRNDADIRGTFKAGRTPLLYRWLILRERVSNRAASYNPFDKPKRSSRVGWALSVHIGMTYLQFLAFFPTAISSLSISILLFIVHLPFEYNVRVLM